MKRSLWLLIGACTCFSASAYGSPWDKLDAALSELARRSGTTVDRLRVDPAVSALENDRKGTLRLEKYLMAEPQRTPATVESMSENLAELRGVAPRLEVLAKLSWDRPPVSRPLDIENVKLPEDSTSNLVEDAMKRLYAGTGKRFQGKERSKVIEDSRRFPRELQVQVASLIDAVSQASRMRESVVKSSELKQGGAFEGKSHKTANLLRDFLNRWWEENLSTDPKMSRLIYGLETFDLDALYAGAIPLARTLDKAGDALATLNAHGSFHADWQTPLGRVAVGGDGNDTYDGAYALIVDVGGNDVYRGPGAASGQDPVALVLDLGGDDRYAAGDSAMAGPGGAILGYAGIVDAGSGKDTYEATSWAGGFGFLGVGWIDDRGGDDVYRMQLLSQGSALFGIGLLLNESGHDQFRLESMDAAFLQGQSQGFGGPLGVGVLIDLEGQDAFIDTDILAGSDATPHGFAQGAAWGGAGHEWAGGLGWLLDAGGDDTYRGSTNAQGVGVGLGLGVLADVSGNDEYLSEAQCLGAGSTLGTGILYDGAGNDRYDAREGAMGSGSNLGLGMLLEGSGDDVYFLERSITATPAPSVASSFQQGAGWLLDLGGNDTYPNPRGEVVPGLSVPWRAPVPGVSVLIDVGQPDTKETFSPCRSDGPAVGGILILSAPNPATPASPSAP
jgi:hypothetical protein